MITEETSATKLEPPQAAQDAQGAGDILQERKRRVFSKRTLVFLVLALAIICFLVSQINVKQTAQALSGADVSLVLLSAFFYLCSNFFKSVRFNILLRDSGISVPKMFAISGYQNFFNQIMPARTGELTFLYYTKTMAQVKTAASLHALLVSRMFDLVMIAAFFVFCLLLLKGTEASPALLVAAVFLVIASLAVAVKMPWFVSICRRLFNFIISASKISDKPLVQKISGKVNMLAEDFSAIKMKSIMPSLTFVSAAVWMCLYAFSYTTVIAFGVQLGIVESIVGSTGAVLTNVLPINSFGSFGTLEAGWTGGFMFVGMSMQDAVTTGFGYHLINFFAAAAIALVCFVAFAVAKRLRDRRPA